MGRPGIIAGGIAFLVGLILVATNQLFESSFQAFAGGIIIVFVGFCVMWYSIPKKKRFGDLETPWASNKYRKYYGVFLMAFGALHLGSWVYFGARWPDGGPLLAGIGFGAGAAVLAWHYLKHRRR